MAAVRNEYEQTHTDAKAKDLNIVGKNAGAVFEASKGQVNGDALLHEMLAKMSSQQIAEYLGIKQGSKGISAMQQLKQEVDYEGLLKSHDAAGVTQRMADEKMKALSAAYDRMNSSVTAASNAFVAANSGVIKAFYDLAAGLASFAGGLSDGSKKVPLGDRRRRHRLRRDQDRFMVRPTSWAARN